MVKENLELTNQFGDTLKGLSWLVDNPKGVIIIFTGMQEHSNRYDEFARFLNKDDLNVYCLDHYGQGLNIKENDVKGKWPDDGFKKSVETFKELLDKVKIANKPMYVFAHSMGSFMAQKFIQLYSKDIDKVIICGTDFASKGLMSFAYRVSKILSPKKKNDLPNKKLAGLVTGAFSQAVKNHKTDFDWLSYNEENVKTYIDDPLSGYIATGRFYKEFLNGMRKLNDKKGLNNIRKDLKIFIIAGEEDPVGHNAKGPKKVYAMYKKLNLTNAEVKIYTKMRHEILNEINKEIVYNDIINFLRK